MTRTEKAIELAHIRLNTNHPNNGMAKSELDKIIMYYKADMVETRAMALIFMTASLCIGIVIGGLIS